MPISPMTKTDKSNNKFKWQFLLPRYWSVWLLVFILAFFSLLPAKIRDPILARLSLFISRFAKKARQRVRINLFYCFPSLSQDERDKIMQEAFELVLPVTVLLVRVVIFNGLGNNINWQGMQYIEQAKNKHKNIIFFVPHVWAIDIPAILLAKTGLLVSGFIHSQKNPLVDWLWNFARLRFGGRLHTRNDGIKPFIETVRSGFAGIYLPDEDHGIEQSVFAPFFATYKATLPTIGRLAKICNADIIPLFAVYDIKNSVLTINIKKALPNLDSFSSQQVAELMNQEIESLVSPNPEQYAWVLKYLKTRKEQDPDPYSRTDI